MKQKSLGFIDISATEIKKKMTADVYINGINYYSTQTKSVARHYAKKLTNGGKKMKVYELILRESK